jgi:hypothetical protein
MDFMDEMDAPVVTGEMEWTACQDLPAPQDRQGLLGRKARKAHQAPKAHQAVHLRLRDRDLTIPPPSLLSTSEESLDGRSQPQPNWSISFNESISHSLTLDSFGHPLTPSQDTLSM